METVWIFSLSRLRERVREKCQSRSMLSVALPNGLRIVLPDGSIGRYKRRSIKGGLRHYQAVENAARPAQLQGLFGDCFEGPVLDREAHAPLQFCDNGLRGHRKPADLA